jgi:pSer/pThr/pTyr-binding forkhead associated (FHA) protein
MTQVHLRIIDGSQRGRVFEDLETPVTIGREEGNAIQLNDDRVSRYHVKIQEDHDRMLLTDLTSTNGTQVNGEEVQLRILKHGDLITIGRSVLLYGSRDQIANRLAKLRGADSPADQLEANDPEQTIGNLVSLDFELGCGNDHDLQATLHTLEPPQLPGRMDAVQAAELSELLEYLHIRLRRLISSVSMNEDENEIRLIQQRWHDLTDLQARLAEYMRKIGEPDSER